MAIGKERNQRHDVSPLIFDGNDGKRVVACAVREPFNLPRGIEENDWFFLRLTLSSESVAKKDDATFVSILDFVVHANAGDLQIRYLTSPKIFFTRSVPIDVTDFCHIGARFAFLNNLVDRIAFNTLRLDFFFFTNVTQADDRIVLVK